MTGRKIIAIIATPIIAWVFLCAAAFLLAMCMDWRTELAIPTAFVGGTIIVGVGLLCIGILQAWADGQLK